MYFSLEDMNPELILLMNQFFSINQKHVTCVTHVH